MGNPVVAVSAVAYTIVLSVYYSVVNVVERTSISETDVHPANLYTAV